MQQLSAELGAAGLGGMDLVVRHALVDVVAVIDPDEARGLLVELAEQALAYGYGDGWVVGRIGLLLALLGEDTSSVEYLKHGERSRSAAAALACTTLRYALRTPLARRDLPLEALDACLSGGAPLSAVVEAVATRSSEPLEPYALGVLWTRTLAERQSSP